MSETREAKALRYLAEGRVTVIEVDPKRSYAELHVQGSRKKPYKTIWNQGAWQCDCEARVECIHIWIGRLLVRLEPIVDLTSPETTNEELEGLLNG